MADPITIVVCPSAGRPGMHDFYLGGGRLGRSKTPFLAAARVLLERGYVSRETVLQMQHMGRDEIALKSSVGYAASMTVSERKNGRPVFELWRPYFLVRDAEP